MQQMLTIGIGLLTFINSN